MATTPTDKPKSTDIAIFGRLLNEHRGEMSPDLARYVLGLGFGDGIDHYAGSAFE